MFELYSQLPKDKEQLRQHVAALSAMTKDREHQELFDHLYECLSILDAKSISLLSFNSIIAAVFAVFMLADPHGLAWLAVHFGMAMILVSCFLLLPVVWVHWSTTADIMDPDGHAFILLDVRSSRTVKYRRAWYFSVAGMTALSLFVALRIVAHFLH